MNDVREDVDVLVRCHADLSADAGNVVDVHNIDGNRRANAHRGIGGGAVGLRVGHGAVPGDDIHRPVHVLLVNFLAVPDVLALSAGRTYGPDRDIAVKDGSRGVILEVQDKRCRNRDPAFAGLGLLAIAVLFHDAGGGDVLAAVHVGKSRGAGDGLVSLGVALTLVVVASRRGAAGPGVGRGFHSADGVGADKDAVSGDAVLEGRLRAVVNDAQIESRADRDAARGIAVRENLVLGVVFGIDDSRLQLVPVAQLIYAAESDRAACLCAQIGVGAAAGDVQRQHGHDGHAAARAAGLGDHRVLNGLLGHDAEIIHAGDLEGHAVLYGGGYVGAGNGHGDAGAHARLGSGRSAVGETLGAEVHVRVGADLEVAAIEENIDAVINLRIGFCGAHVDRDSAAHADIAVRVTGGGFHGGVSLLGVGVQAQSVSGRDAGIAADDGVVGGLNHVHADGHADVGAGSGGVPLRKFRLNVHLGILGKCGGNIKGIGPILLQLAVNSCLSGLTLAIRVGNDRLDAVLLEIMFIFRGQRGSKRGGLPVEKTGLIEFDRAVLHCILAVGGIGGLRIARRDLNRLLGQRQTKLHPVKPLLESLIGCDFPRSVSLPDLVI